MAKTVMIFGAGATLPFFCPPITTSKLTDLVQNRRKWKDLLDRYNTEMCRASCLLDCKVKWEPVSHLIQRAFEVKGCVNFEELIGFCDLYSSYVIHDSYLANSGIGIETKRQHDLLRFFNVRQPNQDCQYWQMVPFLFRQIIAEAIEEWVGQYRSKNYCSLLIRQKELLLGQLRQGDLSCYSFNYDDVLLQTVSAGKLPLQTGFVSGRFCGEKFLKAPSILAFLHGHASWALDNCGMREFGSISDANRWRIGRLFTDDAPPMEFVDESGAYDFNSFLTTGLDKDPSFNRKPYCAYHQRLAYDLMSADRLIVVGYSFRDQHVDRFLLNFLDLKPTTNKVMVIDRWDYDIDQQSEFTNPFGSLRRVLAKFDGTSIPFTQGGNGRINNVGYGPFCGSIWIYKKGYADFLVEWETVLDEWQSSDSS